MPKQINNPNLDIPLEEGEMTNATDDVKELSLEEIEAELERRKKPEEQETQEEPEVEQEEQENEPEESEEEGETKFKDKSPEELVEMYKNVEKMAHLHDDELGKLRKQIKEHAEEKKKNEELALQEVERKLFPETQKWTEEQKTAFFDGFSNDPQSALLGIIEQAMKPYTKLQAVSANQAEINRLKEEYKDGVVPYVDKEINDLISANQSWWKKYGSGIFEHSYNVFRNKKEVFDKYARIRQEKLEAEEMTLTEEERARKRKAFVEGRVAQKPTLPKEKTVKDFKAIEDPEKAIEAIEKELKRRNVQFS